MSQMEKVNDGGDCRETIAKLYEFLDGELKAGDHEMVRRHIEDCSPCLEAFEFEAELKSMIKRKLSGECVTREFRQRLSTILEQEPPTI
ncbi:MAG: mycothiol system anti-sigma-R factor [Acidimicrobiaceae bacterium]|nr:mycothiol system anti-sigma-R factor [Acidimicrobiaceae bacterium]